jgi:hypothetical protein
MAAMGRASENSTMRPCKMFTYTLIGTSLLIAVSLGGCDRVRKSLATNFGDLAETCKGKVSMSFTDHWFGGRDMTYTCDDIELTKMGVPKP